MFSAFFSSFDIIEHNKEASPQRFVKIVADNHLGDPAKFQELHEQPAVDHVELVDGHVYILFRYGQV